MEFSFLFKKNIFSPLSSFDTNKRIDIAILFASIPLKSFVFEELKSKIFIKKGKILKNATIRNILNSARHDKRRKLRSRLDNSVDGRES